MHPPITGEPANMTKPKVRALLVDDEPLARKRIRSLLEKRSDVEIIGECRDGIEAIKAIQELEPDLVFLDIQMPEIDGFEVIEKVGVDQMPQVVFVTAFDEHALAAFKVAALDFLLKPFDDDRFDDALKRAIQRIQQQKAAEIGERLACLVDAQDPNRKTDTPRRPTRLAIEKRGHIYFVPVSDILWIEAEGAYVRLHTAESHYLRRDSLKRLEKSLDPLRFVRIHRSTMVDVQRIAEMSPLFHGEYQVKLTNGQVLKLSRSYRHHLPRLIEA